MLAAFSTVSAQSDTDTVTIPVGVLAPTKDTLYLADNEIGHQIKAVWDMGQYAGQPPVIIFMPEAVISEKKRLYSGRN